MAYPRRLRRAQTLLLTLLILTQVGYWVYTNLINPLPRFMGVDPEAAYALNSLGVFKGQGYTYIDHPGTPLSMIGTALYAFTYPFIGGPVEFFVDYHLRHPELFMLLGHGFLLLITIICTVLLVRFAIPIKDWVDVLASIALPASYFAIHPEGFGQLSNWSHNYVAFGFGSLLLLGLLLVLRQQARVPRWQILGLGFAAGVFAAFTIYFAVWIIGIASALMLYLAFERRWRQAFSVGLQIGLCAILGFVVATLPILSQYPVFLRWIQSLFNSQGLYGTGASGFVTIEGFTTNLIAILTQGRSMVAALGLLLFLLGVLLIWRRRQFRRDRALWAVVFGVLFQSVIAAFLIIKHPRPPYLGAVLAAVPIFLAISVMLLKFPGPVALALRMGLAVGLIGLYGRQLDLWINIQNHEVIRVAEVEQDLRQHLADYAAVHGKSYESLQVLFGWGAYANCFRLYLGNSYVNFVFDPEIAQICPNNLMLDAANGFVRTPSGEWVALDKLQGWDAAILDNQFVEAHPGAFKHVGFHMKTKDDQTIIFFHRADFF